MTATGPGSERTLILAPVGRDSQIASAILGEAGLEVGVCTDLHDLVEQLRHGAAVAVIVEEALQTADISALVAWVDAQPSWSDFPFVLLVGRGGGPERNPAARRLTTVLGNVSFLERPFHPTVLLSAVRTALRGRGRQYEARERIDAVRSAEERFRTMADTIPQLAWMAGPDGAVLWYNQRWRDYTGASPDAAPTWMHFLHPGHRERVEQGWRSALVTGHAWEDLFPLRAADGAYRWFLTGARPLQDADGQVSGWFGTHTDVTEKQEIEAQLERRVAERTVELEAANRQLADQIAERERMEAALRQAQRLEAVGQLTSGVAHDFNNLLTVVLGNIRQIRRGATDPATLRRLDMMAQAAERGATLTAQMLAFSRRQKLELRPIDLNEAVAGMRDLLQSTMGGSVRIETDLADDLWLAMVDPTQIELVVLNLAINASHAMEVGGALRVSTANVTLGVPVRPEQPPPGEYVEIAVSDTGSGMTQDVLDKAFEPFFTTKEVGKGSGLGLSQVFGLATQSGGGVSINTRLGEGTTVRVFLPRAEGKATVAAPPATPNASQLQGQTVLVVDDDAPVREVTISLLKDLGCRVLEAGSGGAALEVLEAAPQVALVLLDFAMPGMNGAEVAREIAARRPELPVLFATGFADTAAFEAAGEDRIVRKPFVEGDLAGKLARALA